MRILLTIVLLGFGVFGYGQTEAELKKELFFYGDVMLNALEYENRSFAGDKFYDSFKLFLDNHNAFELSQGDIKTVSILSDEEELFKLMTWQVRHLENAAKCFGFVVYPDGSYVELMNTNNNLYDIEYEALNADNWYGALYYNLLKLTPHKYVVFGYKQIDRFRSAKILDVMFVKDGQVTFGEEIFEDKEDLDTYLNRVVLDYSSDAAVNLNYNPGLEMIIHDHLIQRMGQLEGQGPVNVPDGTYEGYVFEDDKWKYKEKVYSHSYGENNAPRPKPVLDKKKKSIFGK